MSPTDPAGTRAGKRGRVHLVYPHGKRISAPDSIGRELGRRLERRYEVIYHDWFELGAIEPQPGDVLLGHPHPDPRTVFRASLRKSGWRRRIIMAPFSHADLGLVAFEDGLVPHCDLFLAITGSYWFRTLGASRCSHWQPKMIQLEHAVDPGDFPRIKTSFAAPGKRRVLYVGRSGRGKGTDYLAEIAALVPEAGFGWMGGGEPIRGLTAFGYTDFGSQAGKDLVSQFDFLVSVGSSDPNPTTILEAMAWGLIPVCTPTAGYETTAGIANVPTGDAPAAAAIVRRLLSADESELLAMQSANWKLIDEFYTWDRVAAQVIAAMESTESPPTLPESPGRRLIFAFSEATSPHSRLAYWPPARLVSRIRRRLRRVRSAGGART